MEADVVQMLSARSRFTSSSQRTPAMPSPGHAPLGALYYVFPAPIIIPEGLKVPWGDSQVTLDGPALCKHVVTGTEDQAWSLGDGSTQRPSCSRCCGLAGSSWLPSPL